MRVLDFRKEYLPSSAAGLHVIASVIAAARLAETSPHRVVHALAELPWKRDALQSTKAEDGAETPGAHMFFEGTLAKTE
ncbi:hypothetical protein ACWD1Y_18300 [Streptomyces sp. NPDC002814]